MFRKKGGMIKMLLIGVGALIVGAMFSDKIKSVVGKVPVIGGMLNGGGSDDSEA